jgi:predicted GNAT family N-acyltransferase
MVLRQRRYFDVSLLFHVTDETARESIVQNLPWLRREEPLMDAAGSLDEEGIDSFRFLPAVVLNQSNAVLERLRSSAGSPRLSRVVVVSDRLVKRKGSDRYEPTDLVKEMRQPFRMQRAGHLLGLVGLVDGEPHRTTDIDLLASLQDVRSTALKSDILRVANALWLKSPFRHRTTREEEFAVKVRWARSQHELRESLGLRFQVYDALGYLEEGLSQNPDHLELDWCDTHALHLCAVDSRSADVVGTLRLVLPAHRKRCLRDASWIPDRLDFADVSGLSDVVRAQGVWIERIAEQRDSLWQRILQATPLTPLPIMCNSDFGERWPRFLEEYGQQGTGEISRVVVRPRYRGMGISRLLMRAAIATAVELKLSHLLLECIPQHVAMYSKYGFTALPKHHCRARDLDQLAIGMRLCLQDEASTNIGVATVNRDRRMLTCEETCHQVLLGSQGLCLCQFSDCWKQAKYRRWGDRFCPLADRMRDL